MSEYVKGFHFTPVAVGDQDLAGPWGPGVRNCYVLHYVYSGRGIVECAGRTIAVGVGQSFLVYANVPIKYIAEKSDPWSYIWVDFDGDDTAHLLSRTGFTEEMPVSPVFPENEVLPLFKKVHESFGNELHMRYDSIGDFYKLYAYYLKRFPSEEGKPQVSYMQEAVTYIKLNMHRHISVNDIAEHICVSRAHLYRIFRNGVSCSPAEFMIKCRVEGACEYLENSDLQIKEIAYSFGYDNPLYFTKVFHRVIGMTPGQYRKIKRPGHVPAVSEDI